MKQETIDNMRENRKLMNEYIKNNDLPNKIDVKTFIKMINDKRPSDSYLLQKIGAIDLHHEFYKIAISAVYGDKFYTKLLEDKMKYSFYFIKK